MVDSEDGLGDSRGPSFGQSSFICVFQFFSFLPLMPTRLRHLNNVEVPIRPILLRPTTQVEFKITLFIAEGVCSVNTGYEMLLLSHLTTTSKTNDALHAHSH